MKRDWLQAVKQLAKNIDATESIICDKAGDQTSNYTVKLSRDIGTTLMHLEEGTPWANKAEFYIGLINEAVIKYMK